MSPHDPGSHRVRLFKSSRLETLTLISLRTFAVAWTVILPLVAWAGWGAVGPWQGLGLFLAGFLLWTLFEYAIHRYLFHLEPDHPAAKAFIFLLHGNHHDYPNDPLRGMMPLMASLPAAAAIWGGFVLLFGAPGTWFFLGFIVGYVTYDLLHFATHQWGMRGKLASALKRHHMRHHYLDDTANYAISAIFWDRVFGTNLKSVRQ